MATFFSEMQTISPGPGRYNGVNLDLIRPKAPTAVILERRRESIGDVPGPGTYDFNECTTSLVKGVESMVRSQGTRPTLMTKGQLARTRSIGLSNMMSSIYSPNSRTSSLMGSIRGRSGSPALYSEDKRSVMSSFIDATRAASPSFSFGAGRRKAGGPFDTSYAEEFSNIASNSYRVKSSIGKGRSSSFAARQRDLEMEERERIPGPGRYSIENHPDNSIAGKARAIQERARTTALLAEEQRRTSSPYTRGRSSPRRNSSPGRNTLGAYVSGPTIGTRLKDGLDKSGTQEFPRLGPGRYTPKTNTFSTTNGYISPRLPRDISTPGRGPASYNLTESLRHTSRSSTMSSMHSGRRDDAQGPFYTGNSLTSSLRSYDVTRGENYLRPDSVTKGKLIHSRIESTSQADVPGPGRYRPELSALGSPRGPAFSMSGRTKMCIFDHI